MKPLARAFRKNGFEFEQVRREGRVAIFVKRKGEVESFEVVKVQSHNGFTVAGVVMEPAETYPSSESWGTNGWTCMDMEAAKVRFNWLVDAAAAF